MLNGLRGCRQKFAKLRAKIAHALYRGKFLTAVSVGFVPLRWENGAEDADYSRKYLEQELLEVSAVAIPANPNALALALKSGAVEKSDLRDLADLLRQTLGVKNPLPGTKERGEGEGEALVTAELFQIARELRDILRHT